MLSNVTPFGWFHTILSLLSIASGVWALVRYRQFLSTTRSGAVYLWTTAIVSATGLGLFPHGGFVAAHVLSLITLAVLAVGLLAERTRLFGRAGPPIRVVAYSATILSHLEALATEICTRFPAAAPLAVSTADLLLHRVYTVLTVLVIAFVIVQLRVWRVTSR